MGNSWITALIFAALGTLTFWLWNKLDEDAAKQARPKLHEPDYYLTNMVRNSMDEDGSLSSVLKADKVVHFPDDDSTELARPRMEIYNGSSNPWYVVADSGLLKSGNDVILLHGKVRIWRLDGVGNRELEVVTTELRVFPKVQYAETDNAATLTSPTSVTHTIGFKANFEHDRVELLERVRSHHEVN